MRNKINLAVFASTKGTDLQAIIEAKKNNQLPNINLKFVLSDKKDCLALKRSQAAGIKTVFVNPKNKNREEFDAECLEVCLKNKIDYILLIGYMRIISPVLLDKYFHKVVNIHPSLLPKYPGMDLDVYRDVLFNKETETGCTLHYATEKLDAGPVIMQKRVTIDSQETVESLKTKVQTAEQKLILEFLDKL